MTIKINFNKEKTDNLRLEDIDTGCYKATHLSKTYNRLIFIHKYKFSNKQIVMIFDEDGKCVSTCDNIKEAFEVYTDWEEVNITIEVD